MIERLEKATFGAAAATPYEQEVRRVEERVLVDRVTWLATSAPNAQVRAVATLALAELAARLKAQPGVGDGERAQHALMAADIKRFLERPAEGRPRSCPPDAPPGAPIGGGTGIGTGSPPRTVRLVPRSSGLVGRSGTDAKGRKERQKGRGRGKGRRAGGQEGRRVRRLTSCLPAPPAFLPFCLSSSLD